MSENDLMLKVAALKVISTFTKDRYEEARQEAAAVLGPGDRQMVRSPLGNAKLGPVYRTDPKPTAVVTDLPALTTWFEAQCPDLMESGYQVSASEKEVIAVLFEHAPHLLRKHRRISPDALSDLRRACASLGQVVGPGGEADVPGIEVQVADGVVACKPDDGALLAVMELIGAQRLELDGTLRPELTAGDSNG